MITGKLERSTGCCIFDENFELLSTSKTIDHSRNIEYEMIGIHLSELRLLNRNFTIYLFHMEQDQSYNKDECKVQ